VYAFGDFRVDAAAHRVTRGGDLVAIPERHFAVLLQLLSHAGFIVSKDALVSAVWQDVAVTDNSLEQAISSLRRVLGAGPEGEPYIQTVPRQGYRFRGHVTRTASRLSDAALDELLAPHRAWIEGRAALETLERDQIVRARDVFERVLTSAPDQASAHVGLANACVMQFEMTRTDVAPDVAALTTAAHHAREACRLEPAYGEAWATLGFVLDRTGNRTDALAASRRAVTLEPDNWRHHFRLAYVSWGEERLRAAHRALALLPGFPLAHWLAATVHVARCAFDEAERELAVGIVTQEGESMAPTRFSAVALHWLTGLIHLTRGEEERALASFERELSFEASGQLYARECCANAWYAIGALRLRQERSAEARDAFANAVARVSQHPLARIAHAALSRDGDPTPGQVPGREGAVHETQVVDAAIRQAIRLVLAGDHAGAARVVDEALAGAPAGNAGWLVPLEPLLRVNAHPGIWAQALARLRTRAA
jgi:DNA-binding winged helix-turn-helix (wHTH) protein